MLDKIVKLLEKILEILLNKSKEVERISTQSKRLLWHPLAEIHDFKVKTRGIYKNNYPVGAVIHFTAGRNETKDDAVNTAKYLANSGLGALVLSNDGKIIQTFSLDKWASHAGVSKHETLGESLSSKLVGIEVCCGGKLVEKQGSYFTWFNKLIPEAKIRFSKDAICPGHYEKFTESQEKALFDLILWLKENNPDVFKLENVFGHDEIADPRGRKSDPGGSLFCSMDTYRKKLVDAYDKKSKTTT